MAYLPCPYLEGRTRRNLEVALRFFIGVAGTSMLPIEDDAPMDAYAYAGSAAGVDLTIMAPLSSGKIRCKQGIVVRI
ncbi:hypothetical protein HanRHA438_Chr05g0211481 [Helianthus annuus]|uniref:Uncharacterized protein n=1 Tax=Helianthus annuus TaxID=4232 RepID=A0A9K3IX28_HELAN|nr:hypothetical protein HanXRQr2_Chr05g0201631 [Helianthus annuus]KAJ0569395.1 hypothetical protein HanHA300_Chr05g0165691 [Helianthus annuus]KAJ0575856.1 hypothetical protein HanIR_Chr05g0217571 [Helianthus annuus]KAJ0583706.1 hypothetical protein HanHA89_Chr05g0179741 [Helianthus annuus]KAJ0746428.1 hypothetical protein HanOQP8_Chr05g0177481 [Helianthus annuus]